MNDPIPTTNSAAATGSPGASNNINPNATPAASTAAFRQLLCKELRLQRGNLLFAVAATILGLIALPLIASNAQALGGFPPRDIQTGLMLAALLPVLIIILPAMIGSTAAAAEKPLGVLAWQSALPLPRWKIILAKTIIIAAACAVVAGVFPYILRPLLLEPDILSNTFRGFWTGWLALLFAAIGFFAGSFAKDDYQGLLLSLVPATIVFAALILPDPLLRVVPFTNLPLSRPWVVVVRLLLIAVLLLLLATPMHVRIPTRRWRRMSAALIITFCAGTILTGINIHIEGHVLASADRTDHQFAILKNTQPDISRAETKPVVSLSRGWISNSQIHTLDDGRRIVMNAVMYHARGSILTIRDRNVDACATFVLITSDGQVREFPQIFGNFSNMAITGISADQKWLLLSQNGLNVYLCGPMCISIPLQFMPDTIANAMLSGFDMHYLLDATFGWALPKEQLEVGANDLYLDEMNSTGFVVRNAVDKMPKNSTLYGYSYFPPGIIQAGIKAAGERLDVPSSMLAILRAGNKRGELEITGFVKGEINSASTDGQWVSAGSKTGPVYRHVQPYQKAAAHEPISRRADKYKRMNIRTTQLDNGTTRVSSGWYWDLPIIQTTSGPATIMKYATVASVQTTTRVIQQQTFYKNVFICDDIGIEIVNLETGTSTSVSLKLPGEGQISIEATQVNAIALPASAVWYTFDNDWYQSSQTLAMPVNGIVRIADFSNFSEGKSPKITIAPRLGNGWLLGDHKYMQERGEQDGHGFWLSTW